MSARIDELQTFALIARTGSLATASRELGVAPSTVTKQLQALERRLGVRLVHRTTRRVVLTELGRRYRQRVDRLLEELTDMDAEIRDLHAAPTGKLRISAPQEFGRQFLCDFAAEFVAEHPELGLDLELTDRLVDLVHEERDAVIRIARARDSSLAVRRLGVCRMVLCASPAYLARRGRPQSPSDLHDHDCILYEYLAEPSAWTFRWRGRKQSIFPRGRLRTNAGWAMRAMAVAGQGVALLPAFLVAEDIRAGRLEGVLAEALDADLSLMVLRPHRAPIPAKVRAFVDFVVRKLGEREEWE